MNVFINQIKRTSVGKKEMLFICFLLLHAVPLFAKTPQPPTNVTTKTETLDSNLNFLKEYKDSIREERQILEQQSETHFQRLDNLLNRVIWGLGILGVAALGIFYWSFGSSRKELQGSLNAMFNSHVKDLVEEEAKLLRLKYEELRTQVDALSEYQNRKVTWVCNGISVDEEIQALQAIGVKNIDTLAPQTGISFSVGDADLVIFSYDGSDDCHNNLKVVINELSTKTPARPVLIYTFNKNGQEVRIKDNDRDILKKYMWHMPVNFPATLVSGTKSLIQQNYLR